MVLQVQCATCFRWLGDIIYYYYNGQTLDEILKESDIIRTSKLCCITHLYTMTETIKYQPYRMDIDK